MQKSALAGRRLQFPVLSFTGLLESVARAPEQFPPQIPPHWGCRYRVVGVDSPESARGLGGDHQGSR